ncbi:MAG: PAS domain S-box protein [Desulfobacteraceae bacterium]|jgi:PAS domain S-box-containing protein
MNNKDIIPELENLKRQNRLLTELLENSRDMLYRISLPDGRYEYVSPACIEIFGYRPEEFYSSPLLIKKILHPDFLTFFDEQWPLLLAGKAPPFYEYQIIDSSDNKKWIFQKNVIILDSSGKPAFIEGTVSDITEQKNLAKELMINASRLREAQRMACIGYWYWDIESGDVEWSEEVYKIFQQDPKTFKPQIDSIMALSPWPEDHVREQEIMQKAIKNHDTGTYEQRFLFPDGSTGYYTSTFKGIYDDNDDLIAMRGTVQDITKRKRTEEALRTSESRFRELVEMLPEAVFETNLELEILFANQRAIDLFGYTRDELSGGLSGISMIAQTDRERLLNSMARRLKGHDEGPQEYLAKKKDGATFPILFHASPIFNDGKAAGFRGILIDMTERKLVEAEKARLEEQYMQAQKVESIGRLAGGVAHDLNNLLTPILGYSELLLEDLASNDLYAEPLSEIYTAVKRARGLVGQLLAFSRKQTLQYKILDMNHIIDGIKNLLRRTIREDINLNIVTSPTPQVIKADMLQIEQVILNLAVNAQDAMPEGGALTIETGIVTHDAAYVKNHFDTETGPFVMLAISDTGHGMDAETLNQIFEPFFSTKGEMGTGLGLATVYGIIKQHNGNIFAYSEVGVGSTFKIYLPYHGNEQIDSIRKTGLDGLKKKGSETILLTEDNQNVRQMVKNILTRQGYEVIEAEDGEDALNLLGSCDKDVHLLLTDVIMPGMNGRDLYNMALKKRPGLKVIYMSGYTDNVIEHYGVLNEEVRFIQKPFSPNDLINTLQEILNQ